MPLRLGKTVGSPQLAALGTGVLAALVSLFFFCPRFVLWRGLNTPPAWIHPEVNRAADVLRQLEHPFVHIGDFSNKVIQWRLLFPLLGHALHLPAWLFLALPFVGSLAVLVFIARLAEAEGCIWKDRFAAVLLAATSSWFFVSTGWLGYFDSWYVLCLLLVVCTRDRRLMLVVAFLGPWIDERFILGSPLCLLLRDRFLEEDRRAGKGDTLLSDAAWWAAAVLPYLLIRLGAYFFGTERVVDEIAKVVYADKKETLAGSYVSGLWHGFRWGWVLIFVWLGVEWRRNRARALAAGLLLTLTLAANLLMAGDLSRSTSVALPAVVLGFIAMIRALPGRLHVLLPAICILNLVFPARHVVGNWAIPIYYFHAEWASRENPAREVNPDTYNNTAIELISRGQLDDALALLDDAVKLDPGYVKAHINRSVVLRRMGRPVAALLEINRAIALGGPKALELYYRGVIRADTGDLSGGRADLEEALRLAPMDWSEAGSVRKALDALNRPSKRDSSTGAIPAQGQSR